MKTILIYASTHHGNTKKVAQRIGEQCSVDLVDITKVKDVQITEYDMVGLASGVYFGSFHKDLNQFIEISDGFQGKKVCFLDTCGMAYKDYTSGAKKALQSKGAVVLGSFQCRGYDTFGIFGKIGGIAKKHPNEKDMDRAVAFFKKMTSLAES